MFFFSNFFYSFFFNLFVYSYFLNLPLPYLHLLSVTFQFHINNLINTFIYVLFCKYYFCNSKTKLTFFQFYFSCRRVFHAQISLHAYLSYSCKISFLAYWTCFLSLLIYISFFITLLLLHNVRNEKLTISTKPDFLLQFCKT